MPFFFEGILKPRFKPNPNNVECPKTWFDKQEVFKSKKIL
jgi:hypothetical protein